MGFLDNSGDIILDAVLTDTGRMRLSRGDGTFKVTKYAFGDDEINYGLYNAQAASGSAYYDLEILQTPILEAFTNNRSSLKYKLITITNNNLLFLPTMILNQVQPFAKLPPPTTLGSGTFLVSCNSTTFKRLNLQNSPLKDQTINGTLMSDTSKDAHLIRIDQGLNTDQLDATPQLTAELRENQYMIQIDNRLGRIYDVERAQESSPAFIDDDQVASYYVTLGVGGYIALCTTGDLQGQGTDLGAAQIGWEQIPGPRGTKLRFSILAQSNLKASSYLFETMGTEKTFVAGFVGPTNVYQVLDSTIKVTGVTTGYSIDIPIRYVRCKDC